MYSITSCVVGVSLQYLGARQFIFVVVCVCACACPGCSLITVCVSFRFVSGIWLVDLPPSFCLFSNCFSYVLLEPLGAFFLFRTHYVCEQRVVWDYLHTESLAPNFR